MARKSTSGRQAEALEKARARRHELDADRHRLDAAVDDLVARFLVLSDSRSAKEAKIEEIVARHREELVTIDAEQGRVAQSLRDLGQSAARIADLLEVPRSEVRRWKQDATVGAVDGQRQQESDETR